MATSDKMPIKFANPAIQAGLKVNKKLWSVEGFSVAGLTMDIGDEVKGGRRVAAAIVITPLILTRKKEVVVTLTDAGGKVALRRLPSKKLKWLVRFQEQLINYNVDNASVTG